MRNDDLFMSFLKSEKCRVNSWSIVIPQLRGQPHGNWTLSDEHASTLHQRGWKQNDPSRGLKTIADPIDRVIAKVLTSNKESWPNNAQGVSAEIRTLSSEHRAIILLYPLTTVKGQQLEPPILGFESYLPAHPAEVGFRVRAPRDVSRNPA